MKIRHINSISGACLVLLLAFSGCGPGDKEMPIPVDTTPPNVYSTSPGSPINPVTGVSVGTTVVVYFDEWVDPATVSLTLTSPGGNIVDGSTAVSGYMAIFNPTTNLVSTSTYAVDLAAGFADFYGNAQTAGMSWSFTTGTVIDSTLPTVWTRSPAVDAVGVATNIAINVTFSEDMNPDTINISTFYVTSVTGAVSYNVSTGTATWTQSSPPLAENTTYTVTISGAEDLNHNALSPTPATWNFTTSIVSAPAAPSGLRATASSSTQIDLSWTDMSGNETGFYIERKTGVAGTYAQIASLSAGVTSYSNTGLTEGTTYYYQVRAYNGIGTSAYSTEANDTTLPATPSGLTATAVSDTQIDLAWTDNSATETLFSIERKTGVAGTYAEITTVGPGVVTYSDTTTAAGTTYYYRVRAYDGTAYSAYSTEATAASGPAAPSGLTATTISETQIDLAWTDNSTTETLFSIERKTGVAGTYAEITTVGSGVVMYSDTTAAAGTTYYYRIRAYDGTVYSAFSIVANASTIPAAPTGVGASATGGAGSGEITVSWSAATGATSYNIYYISTEHLPPPTKADTQIAAGAVISYVFTGSPSTTYYFVVTAVNAGGESVESSLASEMAP